MTAVVVAGCSPEELARVRKAAPEGLTLVGDGDLNEADAVFLLSEDETLLCRWIGHPHLRVIRGADFEAKLTRLSAELRRLTDPEPLEIERKYLIARPDEVGLDAFPHCKRTDIVQTYLRDASGEPFRLRERTVDGESVWFFTQKRQITPVTRVEVERRLSREEYESLLRDTPGEKRRLTKARYCLLYDGQYFELDVFPFWTDRALLELELSGEDEEIRFPPFLRLLREVTGEPGFRNFDLAQVL